MEGKRVAVVGVLAIQGAFAEHKHCLTQGFQQLQKSEKLNCELEVCEVRTRNDLAGLHGLVIPGGESTTMSKFLDRGHFIDVIQEWRKGENGNRPVIWGTCAGLILLANTLHEQKTGGQITLGGLDITASRNLYGRQRESFVTSLSITNEEVRKSLVGSDSAECPGVFIRAPGIQSIDSETVQVLAEGQVLSNGDTIRPVAARQDNMMVTAFHPELTQDYRWHAYFLRLLLQYNNSLH